MAHVVVMGVAGCGKSTVGRALADALKVPFADGDALHPAANIAKMAAGQPLTDEDRWPWLEDVGRFLADREGGAVVASSALRRSYRDAIRRHAPAAFFVHLTAPPAVLRQRLEDRQTREGHFMGAAMLESQLAVLEPLEPDESGVVLRVDRGGPEAVVEATRAAVGRA